MAQHQSIGPAEQVLVAFRAMVFSYDSQVSRWSEVGEPNVCSQVYLISIRLHGSMCYYRIYGRLESTGVVTLDSTLTDRDEYLVSNAKWHQIRTATGLIYGFCVLSESEGSKFSVIIQNTLRSLQGTQTQSHQSQAHQSQLAPDAKGTGRVSPNLKSPNPTQRVPDSPGQDGNWAQRKRDFDVQIDSLCAALSEAIMNGKQEQALEIAKKLTSQKVNLSIKLKNPNLVTMDAGGNTINLRVVVEDKESSGGTFSVKVSPTCTIEKLQQEVFDRFGFPVQVQKWIVGKKVPKPGDTLHDLLVRQSGTTVFLYLLSGKTVGLRQSDVEQLGRGDTASSSTVRSNASCSSAGSTFSASFSTSSSTTSNLRQAVSTPDLSAGNVPHSFDELSREEQVPERGFASLMPQRSPAPAANWQDINGPATFHVDQTMDIQTLQNMLAQQGMAQRSGSASSSNPAVEEVVLNNVDPEEQQAREGGQSNRGWICEMCTFFNQPTRPGCEICAADRPEGYVVPVDTMLNEQERNRLAAEQRQEALFQQAERKRQQEEQSARQRNLATILQAAQQNLIPNQDEFDCGICFTPVEPGEGVVLRECLHRFCRDCLSEHIRHATDPEVQCPHQDDDYACHATLTGQEVKALLSEEDFNKFLNRSLATAESQAANSFHCKTPNCQGWCLYEDNVNTFHCPVCQQPNCLTCKAIHANMNCKEYQEDLKRRAQNDEAAKKTQEYLERMVAGGDAMHCPMCKIILVKKDGCDWMKCSMCRTEICWATRGPRWGPGGSGDVSGGCKCRIGGKKCHPRCKNCH